MDGDVGEHLALSSVVAHTPVPIPEDVLDWNCIDVIGGSISNVDTAVDEMTGQNQPSPSLYPHLRTDIR